MILTQLDINSALTWVTGNKPFSLFFIGGGLLKFDIKEEEQVRIIWESIQNDGDLEIFLMSEEEFEFFKTYYTALGIEHVLYNNKYNKSQRTWFEANKSVSLSNRFSFRIDLKLKNSHDILLFLESLEELSKKQFKTVYFLSSSIEIAIIK